MLLARRLTLVLPLVAAALLAACSTPQPAAPPEEIVRQRATERWNALVARDFARAYTFLAPSYRALVDEKRYASSFGSGVRWKAAEVVGVTCEEERCKANVRIDFQAAISGRAVTTSTHYDETWIREEGQWWMFQSV